MDQPSDINAGVARVFNHHIYELSKGIRPLCFLTMPKAGAGPMIEKLLRLGIAYYVHDVCPAKVNLLFGRPAAVSTVRRFLRGPLCKLSAEHDFMLGVLLGYDREQQCMRYLERLAMADAERALLAPDIDSEASWLDAVVEVTPERAH